MKNLDIKIKKLDPDLPTPCCAYAGDAAMDLRSTTDLVLQPGERALVPTGIALAIPEGCCGLVIPRSGLALKHGITVVNAPGLIDSNYRGEIGVILLNTDSNSSFRISRGDRIAQLALFEVPTVTLAEVDALPETARAEGGFGSSGI